ncbi:hypothetical protein HCN44_008815 [Aphidius gifuensis]|uniref:Palmitoyltransferase n=1 Tax=Aphidius gifuensis TaxID=684658 RepID=A0A835CRR9_APHGI|nr:palmitoyltransferase ZDHHC23-B [Aphidius gifuensis]KAF7991503.1 hypothetical protein HCN44_008815 [Aphidius gifuensis]
MSIFHRLRNPCSWRNGVKQIPLDAIIPIFAVPLLAIIASKTIYTTLIVFVTCPIVVYHLHHNFLRFLPRSKFFLMWTITSVLMLMLVFEFCVVPLLEILPEENLVFIICVFGAIICGYKTRINTDKNCGNQDSTGLFDVATGSEEASSRVYYCRICQTSILGREYHCKWLDCCIGSSNLQWYLTCCLLSAVAFIYGSNLTMTSVCHPFILVGTVLLPDDCSDVYHQFDLALCFVSSVYSLVIGIVVVGYLIYHSWLIFKGTTAHERRLNNSNTSSDNGVFNGLSQLVCCQS